MSKQNKPGTRGTQADSRDSGHPGARVEQVIAYLVAGSVAISVLCILAILIGSAAGAAADNGFSQGIWPTLFITPMIGLPIGFVLIIGLLVASWIRRGRESRATG